MISDESFTRCGSSRSKVFCKKGAFKNSAKFTGKCLCQSLVFNKVVGLRFVTLIKKRLQHKHFPESFAKFLRTSSFIDHLQWLLLGGAYAQKYLLHNSKDKMLRNSDMMVYALHLKQKSTVGFFLRKFRTATVEKKFFLAGGKRKM